LLEPTFGNAFMFGHTIQNVHRIQKVRQHTWESRGEGRRGKERGGEERGGDERKGKERRGGRRGEERRGG
jgi:hypothetical protein